MTVPFDSRHGLITFHVRIWGPGQPVAARLALDTGATQTMINAAVLCLAGYDPASISERHQMTTGSGVEYVPFVTVTRLLALSEERKDFPVIAHTLPPSAGVDGLLGLDFFRDRKLTLDFRAGTIRLD